MNVSIDEMYRIASLINTTTTFTIAYLQELLAFDQRPAELDLVIGNLMNSGFLSVTEQPQFVFNDNTRDISSITVKRYQLVEDKQDEFEQYLCELQQQRLRPEQDGKPHGLCYRILEEYIKGAIVHVQVFERPKTRKEIDDRVEQYLAAAEAEEISNPRYDSRQKKVSEAYLRELYGSYLQAKREWLPAIRQYLRASLLFLNHGYEEKKRNLEGYIIEILYHIWDTCDEKRVDILTQVEDTITEPTGEYTGKYIALLLAVTSIISGITKPAKPSSLSSSLANQELASPLRDEEEITTADRQRVTDVPQPFDGVLYGWPLTSRQTETSISQSVQDTDAIPQISSSIRDQINYPFQKDLTASSPDKITEQESLNKNNDRVSEALLELEGAGVAA